MFNETKQFQAEMERFFSREIKKSVKSKNNMRLNKGTINQIFVSE